MEFISIGSLVKETRTRKNVTRQKLSHGICSEHVLWRLEENRHAADVLMFDIFLQRLGQSPDKLEIVLSSELYSMVRLRDVIAEAVFRRKWRLAELLLQRYPSRTQVDKMYRQRMTACLAYRRDGDCACAAGHLRRAAALTLPEYSDERFPEKIDTCLISTVELENLLALERMNVEGNPEDNSTREMAKYRLQRYMDYIEKQFGGDEECAKLTSKCAWLLGGICYLEKDYMQAVAFCQKGIRGLRDNSILYFILPLLELLVLSEKALGIAPERSKWVQYYDILALLRRGYAKSWYPADALFHNCYQRDCHLDYELIRAERRARNLTQAQLAEGVYQNTESLSRVETGKVSPTSRTFEKLMDKLGLQKGRYNGCVVTGSFEVMEQKRSIDGFLMRRDFEKAREQTRKLRDALDMDISENEMVVRLYEVITAKYFGELTAEEAFTELKELSWRFMDMETKTFFHIPMRNEVLVINNIAILLHELGKDKESADLYRITLEKIQSSKVKIKYRYRSYQLLFSNYVHHYGDMEGALRGLEYEFLCGKAMELVFVINNILQLLCRNSVPKDECDKWIKAVYYMLDLFNFERDKKKYKVFLEKERNINVLD
ncbi:MAG: helix-turn-helix domain-containing protein [Lachnospiraceae bacterium]|nr:helix-turn-helix domain-containing protein [Lachnospiraceae bacterium]